MNLEQALGKILKERGLTLAVAESITGGLVGDRITDVPGSSSYFEGGVTTYSDRSKMELLGVKADTIHDHGAVSEDCAKEMAKGVRDRFHAKVGISVTGIAGPSGATPEKPVGLVYFGFDDGRRSVAERMVFAGGREEIKRAAAEHLIGMAIALIGKE